MSELEYWKKLAKSRERLYSSQLNILAKSHKQALREQIKKIHTILDNLNGERGDLCLYCQSKEYNGKVGIVHKKGCVILQLREEMGML